MTVHLLPFAIAPVERRYILGNPAFLIRVVRQKLSLMKARRAAGASFE